MFFNQTTLSVDFPASSKVAGPPNTLHSGKNAHLFSAFQVRLSPLGLLTRSHFRPGALQGAKNPCYPKFKQVPAR
jgi:hypothetical protein